MSGCWELCRFPWNDSRFCMSSFYLFLPVYYNFSLTDWLNLALTRVLWLHRLPVWSNLVRFPNPLAFQVRRGPCLVKPWSFPSTSGHCLHKVRQGQQVLVAENPPLLLLHVILGLLQVPQHPPLDKFRFHLLGFRKVEGALINLNIKRKLYLGGKLIQP